MVDHRTGARTPGSKLTSKSVRKADKCNALVALGIQMRHIILYTDQTVREAHFRQIITCQFFKHA